MRVVIVAEDPGPEERIGKSVRSTVLGLQRKI